MIDSFGPPELQAMTGHRLNAKVLIVGCIGESNGVWRLEKGRSLGSGKVREEKDVSLGGRDALCLDRFKSRRLQARYGRIR